MHIPDEWLSCPECNGDVSIEKHDDGGTIDVKFSCDECGNGSWGSY